MNAANRTSCSSNDLERIAGSFPSTSTNKPTPHRRAEKEIPDTSMPAHIGTYGRDRRGYGQGASIGKLISSLPSSVSTVSVMHAGSGTKNPPA